MGYNVRKKLKKRLKGLGYKVRQINLVYDPEFFTTTYKGLIDARIDLSKFVYEMHEGLHEVTEDDVEEVAA